VSSQSRDRDSGFAVLPLLADGVRHSGEQLASRLGISRAAVWKQVRRLEGLGVEVSAIRGAGYRLSRAIELLDQDAITGSISASTRASVERLEIFMAVESTNSFLFTGPRPAPGRLAVCLAEFQSGGRGRRGRQWFTPLGRGLCLSVAWVFTVPPEDLAALGLAAGVVARRVLSRHTGLPIRIKWPNDLLVFDRKLGGVLVELSAESHGPCYVVIGIGINVSATPALPNLAGSWAGGATDLAAASGCEPPSRNALAASLIDGLAELLEGYPGSGFADYHTEFADADYLYGRRVDVEGAAGVVSGRAMGIGPDGVLLLEAGDGVAKIISGDISVRPSV
jgi:BirA family biotin operon repressor/biotin-[acetyl-CoA-carboxylase] ligase